MSEPTPEPEQHQPEEAADSGTPEVGAAKESVEPKSEAAAEPARKGFAARLDRVLELLWRGVDSRYFTYALILLTAAAYLSLVTNKLRENSDSVVYLRLAENLAAGKGYTYMNLPHATFVPGWPLILAAAMKLGMGEPWHLNLFIAVLGLGMCWATWTLALVLANRGLANVALVAFAFSEDAMKWSQRPLSEVVFTFIFLLSLICIAMAWRNERLSLPWGLGGALLGSVAIMTRPTGAVLFPAFLAWLWVTVPRTEKKWKRSLLAATICVCGLVPALLWIGRAVRHHDRYRPSYVGVGKSLARPAAKIKTIGTKTGGIADAVARNFVGYYTGRKLGPLWAVAAATVMLLLAAVGAAIALWRRQWLLPVTIAGNLALIALFTRPLPRYAFPSHALLVILAVLATVAAAKRFRLPGRLACAVLFVGLLGLSLVSWDRTRGNRDKPEKNQPYRQLATWLRSRPDRDSLQVCSWQARRVHYFAEATAHRSAGDAQSFPESYCRYGGFDLLVFEKREFNPERKTDRAILRHDRALRDGVKRMTAWGILRAIPQPVPGLKRFEVWRLEPRSHPPKTNQP